MYSIKTCFLRACSTHLMLYVLELNKNTNAKMCYIATCLENIIRLDSIKYSTHNNYKSVVNTTLKALNLHK